MVAAELLFPARQRHDSSPRRSAESMSAFLGRVTGDRWDQVRDVLNEWVSAYPALSRNDLLGRLRSGEPRAWPAAFWELYLHHSFRCSGFDVEVHPSVGGTRTPDFLVSRDGESYYVEAKMVFGSDSGGGSDARLAAVLEALDAVDCPNFFVGLEILAVGATAPPTRQLKRDVLNWLNGLDPDGFELNSLLDDSGERYEWVHDGWTLVFRPWPVRADARLPGRHRLLGGWHRGDLGLNASALSIVAALQDKGSAYELTNRPLVLAIGLAMPFDHTLEVTNALYGDLRIRVDRENPGRSETFRAANGYFVGPGGWQHRHVSGVVIGANLDLEGLARKAPTYWEHPSPITAVQGLDFWRRAFLEGDLIATTEALRSPGDALGIPEVWSQSDPF